ncbi:phosphoglycerate mutase [Seminavis robusta]|uniref:Phosphoglycerate mutase n=1 Tax=Seminavis robusta TaxID=568900 RepID=A0A9N8EMB1_9STRA|nr:phosphoglycerate mutase [Seminavis robusta]|eukprot:Sro1461_g274710.1 phosphoglycerate mutase (274) ;mRNA; f:593-1414
MNYLIAIFFMFSLASHVVRILATTSGSKKQLYILRHGQATHNPRAEEARANGCSYDEFMELMRQDDSLDSSLTDLGRAQAKSVYEQSLKHLEANIQLVVSSPLSRAIETADFVVPSVQQRVCVEDFRIISGWLLNAKRRTRSELQQLFPRWNLDNLQTQEDTLWTPDLETHADCAQRGFQGLCWIMERPEDSILLVTHGGLLRFTMQQHNRVKMMDGRTSKQEERDVQARFGNCELRRYTMEWEAEETENDNQSTDKAQRSLVLTELDTKGRQ